MKTMLIWDRFGEADLAIYVIGDPPEWLPKCHLNFINTEVPKDVGPLLDRVHDALCSERTHCLNPDDEMAGAWVGNKVNLDEVAVLDLGQSHFRVVVCGFVP